MIEKLSSLCVRFMPTFVSPATSMRSPTREWSWARGLRVNRALVQPVRARAPRASPWPRGICLPLKTRSLTCWPIARLAMTSASCSGRLDRLPVDRDDRVGAVAGLEAGLFGGAAGRDAHDLDALHVALGVGRAAEPEPRRRLDRAGGGLHEEAAERVDGRADGDGAAGRRGGRCSAGRRRDAAARAAPSLQARTRMPTTRPLPSMSGAPGVLGAALEIEVERARSASPSFDLRVEAALHARPARARACRPWEGTSASSTPCGSESVGTRPSSHLPVSGMRSARSHALSLWPIFAFTTVPSA